MDASGSVCTAYETNKPDLQSCLHSEELLVRLRLASPELVRRDDADLLLLRLGTEVLADLSLLKSTAKFQLCRSATYLRTPDCKELQQAVSTYAKGWLLGV